MEFQFAYFLKVLPGLASAAIVNIELSIAVMVLSIVGATALTIVRSWKKAWLRPPIALLISFIRGTPLLIQIFLFYYVLPVVGLDLGPQTAGVAAIALNTSVFLGETMRGALMTIDPGQIEAAASLSLSRRLTWRKVILPQLFRRILPMVINEATIVVKGTALLSVITVVDVLRRAQQIASSSYRPFETLLGAALVFLVLNLVITAAGKVVEARHADQRS